MAEINMNPIITIPSTGSMNATIETYKPDSISLVDATIRIVFKGNVIATIQVQDSGPSYKLTGDKDSLRIFTRLCNTNTLDKSPYLTYNGVPSVTPKDFAPTEVDPEDRVPFQTPKSEFESMLQAIEEVARLPPQPHSGAAEGPPRTIFLLVSMHGARLETMRLSPELPKNITYAYAPGECPKLKVSTLKQIERIEKYKKLSVFEILDEYAKDVPDAEKDKIDRYSVLYDQHYQCDFSNSANPFSNGIFILGSNFLDLGVFAPVEFHGSMEVEYPHFDPILYETKSAMELQKINLINVHVLEELSRRVRGESFALEKMPTDPYFSISSNDTGILHYFNSQLSHYLRYCQRLGAEQVVLIDETCRIRSFRPGVGADEREAAADLGPGKEISRSYAPGQMRNPEKRGDYGGRRTKRRRTRRSRRSHKKS